MKSYVQQRHEPDRFLLFFSWLRTSSPFCIGLIAKCEMSEGHSHHWLLFVSGTEQSPLHVAPVIIKHLSLRTSRQKVRQTPFIQVHGRNTRARVQTIICPVGLMHPEVTEISGITTKVLANMKFDVMLMLLFPLLFCVCLWQTSAFFSPLFYHITRPDLLKF